MSTSPPPPSNNDDHQPTTLSDHRSPLRHPVVGDNAPIFITLVVVIPIIVVFILCFSTFCIYRYRKKHAVQKSRHSSLEPIDQSTIANGNSSIKEDQPSLYDSVSEIKRNLPLALNNVYSIDQYVPSFVQNTSIGTPTLLPAIRSNYIYPIQSDKI